MVFAQLSSEITLGYTSFSEDLSGTHVMPENLIKTLRNMNVTNIHDVEYMALYNGSKALDALTGLTSLDLDRAHYKPKELNGKIKKMLK